MDRSIGNEIHALAKMIHRALDNSPEMKKIESVTGTNAWIIGYIAKRNQNGENAYQRDLEKHFGITRSTASKVVNLMVQKKLITRESVPGDARLKKLILTERAIEISRQMSKVFENMEETLSYGLSEEEMEHFYDYIHRMQRNIEMKEERRI